MRDHPVYHRGAPTPPKLRFSFLQIVSSSSLTRVHAMDSRFGWLSQRSSIEQRAFKRSKSMVRTQTAAHRKRAQTQLLGYLRQVGWRCETERRTSEYVAPETWSADNMYMHGSNWAVYPNELTPLGTTPSESRGQHFAHMVCRSPPYPSGQYGQMAGPRGLEYQNSAGIRLEGCATGFP